MALSACGTFKEHYCCFWRVFLGVGDLGRGKWGEAETQLEYGGITETGKHHLPSAVAPSRASEPQLCRGSCGATFGKTRLLWITAGSHVEASAPKASAGVRARNTGVTQLGDWGALHKGLFTKGVGRLQNSYGDTSVSEGWENWESGLGLSLKAQEEGVVTRRSSCPTGAVAEAARPAAVEPRLAERSRGHWMPWLLSSSTRHAPPSVSRVDPDQ